MRLQTFALIAALSTLPAAAPGPAALAAPNESAAAAIRTASSLRKLTATAPGVLEEFPAQPIALRMARGEWECFQVVVTAGAAPLTDLRLADISVDGQTSTDRPFGVEAYWANYVLIDRPSGNRRLAKVWWPDALRPAVQKGQPVTFSLEANRSAVLWVAVQAPYGTAAGRHEGRVRFTHAAMEAEEGNSRPLEARFTLRVEPFDLPAPTMRANAALYYDVLRDWYAKSGRSFNDAAWDAQKQRYYEFLLKYRINAYDLPVAWSDARADAWLRDSRVLSVRVPPLDSPEMAAALTRLRRNRALGKAYYYWIDEPPPARFAEVRQTAQKLRVIEPQLKHLLTIFPNESLKNAADIWCPNIGDYAGLGHFDFARLAKERKAGRETWWYTMAVPRAPYPTWLVDDAASSVRIYGWMMAAWEINGFVYSMVHGWGPKPLENIESFAGTNGDGTLVYPADLVGGEGPMPSLRLMLLRDAIEDYELLQLLPVKTRRGLAERVAGPSPAQRNDQEEAWRQGLYRDLLFSYLQLDSLKTGASAVRESPPMVRRTTARGSARPAGLRTEAFRQPFFFRRFAGETGPVSPRVWLAYNESTLFVSAEVPEFRAESGEWFGVELAPVAARGRWRFVVTAKGRGVAEKHNRDGRFLQEDIDWKYSLTMAPGAASASGSTAGASRGNIEMQIPLSLLNGKTEFRFNALYRQFDTESGAAVLRRAYADDGDVSRTPIARLAPHRPATAKPAPPAPAQPSAQKRVGATAPAKTP